MTTKTELFEFAATKDKCQKAKNDSFFFFFKWDKNDFRQHQVAKPLVVIIIKGKL